MLSLFRRQGSKIIPFTPLRRTNQSLRFIQSEISTVYEVKRKPRINPTLLIVGFIPLFTFGLGTWQLKRLQWKVELINDLEEKLQLPPLSLPKRIDLSVVPDFVFRKVLLKGRWDHTHSMLFAPRVREGVHGVHLVTPLVREDASTVLVDRGFVSNDHLSTYQREEGEVEVLGMLRTSQIRNIFTPDNRPDEGLWYWTDVDAMAKYAGGEHAGVQPVFIERLFEGHAGEAISRLAKGIPIGRPPTVDLRNAHLSYVITWYSLSVLTSIMFIRVLLSRKHLVGRRLPR